MTTVTQPGPTIDSGDPDPGTEHEAAEAEHAGTAEVITEADRRAVERVDRQRQAIDAAADLALTPGVPGRDEFLNLCLQAKLLSMSAAVPAGLRDNPHLCLHVVLIARARGIDPASAVGLIDFIPEDKNHPERGGQLAESPELKCSQVKRLGLGSVELLVEEHDRAVAVALEPGGRIVRDKVSGAVVDIIGEIGRTTFDWEDAKLAQLVDERCAGPWAHWKGSDGSKCGCKWNYRTYPKRMLGWRAKGFCATDNFPEVSTGLYSPEELGAVVDEQGRMIDPATVELPAGYEPPPPPEVPRATQAEVDEIRATIAILDQEGRDELRGHWGRAGIKPITREDFGPNDAKKARSLLNGITTRRRRAGWNEEEARNQAIYRGTRRLIYWMATTPLPEDEDQAQPTAEQPPAAEPAEAPADQQAPAQGSAPVSPPPEAPDAQTPPEAPEPAQEPAQAAAPADEPRVPPGMPDEEVDQIIERVKRMKPDQVIEALRERGKPTTGNQALRARRLTALMCQEHAVEKATAAAQAEEEAAR